MLDERMSDPPSVTETASYEQLVEQVGRERGEILLGEGSARAGIPYAIVATAGPAAAAFLLSALNRRSAPSWVWLCAVVLSVVTLTAAAQLCRHIRRRRRRERELAQRVDELQQRALRGEIPLTDSWNPVKRAAIRRRIERARSAQRPR
jgi:hypothetical protein